MNADKIPCKVLYRTDDEKYSAAIRLYQGCPTVAATKGGRIYLGWCSGGDSEPHMDNYCLLVYSDNMGKTWSKPIIIIQSDKENLNQALDIQLWTDPDGKLRVYWTQNNAIVDDESNASIEGYRKNGYIWCDNRHAAWTMVCDNPDDDNPVFSEPHYWGIGFLRCKPIVLDDGRWMFCNYDQLCDRYGYSISTDCGKTYERCYGGTKVQTDHDEPMAYQRKDGSIRMLARSTVGELGESISNDRGTSWSGGIPSGIESPNSRFWISRTPTGRILLVNNDHRTSRCRMSVRLSEDDGATWKYRRCVDEREALTYPDVEFCNGKILLTYDRERIGVREILFTSFTEDDIMNENYSFDISIACKPDAKK